MAKRTKTKFKRNERGYYPTPYEAVLPLLPHLRPRSVFIEPCAGKGDLIRHLEKHGHNCRMAYDIEPQDYRTIRRKNALDVEYRDADYLITNPPWPDGPWAKGEPTVGMIRHFTRYMPTWLLLSADFMHNKYFAELSCERIVSVGRVKWIPDSKDTGKDNCAWYLFQKYPTETKFYPRIVDK